MPTLIVEHEPIAVPAAVRLGHGFDHDPAECIDELADYAGIKPQIAAITERAMQGELDFESALSERVLLLRELSEGAIARMPRRRGSRRCPARARWSRR